MLGFLVRFAFQGIRKLSFQLSGSYRKTKPKLYSKAHRMVKDRARVEGFGVV